MNLDNQIIEQSDEWHRFCRCVLSEQAVHLPALKIDTQSSEKFIQFLHQHGLEALLLDLLEQQDRSDLLPDSVSEKLVELRRLAHIKEIYRKQHLQNLLHLLNSQHIDCLILKGTALAYHQYANPYQRSRIDSDIFIKIEDKEKIDVLLIDHGFSKVTNVSGDLISHQNTYWQIENGIKHAYDIHWQISNRNAYAKRFNFNQLYADRRKLFKLDSDAFGLESTDAFLHSTVHYFGHRSDERNRLVWIYDLHLLCNQFSNEKWLLLVKKSQEKSLEPLVSQMLKICNQTLQTVVPDQILNKLLETQTQLSEIESKRINTNKWSRVDQFKSDWAVLNFTQRCRLIKEYLFPPTEFILKQNDSTNHLFLPYFYLKRIVIGGTRVLTNNKGR